MEYIPEAGDVVWLDFDPQSGHEQAGHRPALVISPASYNGRTGLMLCCPLTSQIKGYPFEVAISGSSRSVALADQIKNLDWRARNAVRKDKASTEELEAVRTRAKILAMAKTLGVMDIANLRRGDVGQRFTDRQTGRGGEVQQRHRGTFAQRHRFAIVAVEAGASGLIKRRCCTMRCAI
jgi:mRNA interferase MazF